MGEVVYKPDFWKMGEERKEGLKKNENENGKKKK